MNNKNYNSISNLISTVFFIGYFPLRGGGSWAALVCLIYFIFSKYLLVDIFDISKNIFFVVNLITLLVYLPIGIFTINRTITKDNPDPHHVVFDEWVGMFLPIIFLDFNFIALLLSFFIFRFFDIFKPFPINLFEKLPRAYGVLGDDIIAGIFTLICVLIIQIFYTFPSL